MPDYFGEAALIQLPDLVLEHRVQRQQVLPLRHDLRLNCDQSATEPGHTSDCLEEDETLNTPKRYIK